MYPLNMLTSLGCIYLPRLDSDKVAEIQSYLSTKETLLGGHVPKYCNGRTSDDMFSAEAGKHNRNGLGCYDLETVVRCPHLLNKALSHITVIEDYLECEPVMYSMNAFWSFPGGGVRPETQAWHRDTDDHPHKFLAFFMFLTDVEECDAHLYQLGSQDGSKHETPTMAAVYGPAGTCFLENPYGLHMGNKPVSRPRLMAWVRFGTSAPPASYYGDKLYPVEHSDIELTDKERKICRFIIL